MSNSPMIPVFSPSGELGDVPYERLVDVIKNGGKLGVNMIAPDGSHGVVPADKVDIAKQAGGKVIPWDFSQGITQNESVGQGMGRVLKEQGQSLVKSAVSPQGMAERVLDPTGAMQGSYNALQEATLAWNRAKDPRAKIGAAALAALASPFVSAEREAQNAERGQTNSIIAETSVPAMEVAGGEALHIGGAKALESLPSAEKAAASLRDIRNTVGDVPIDMAKPGDTALELWTQSERGANLPAVVRKFVQRATKPGSDPITYAEAKDFQSNVSSLSAADKMKMAPNTKRLLGQLNADLKDSLTDAADTQGKGEQFQQAMKEYHNAMKLKGWSEDAIAAAWKAALAGAGIYGAGKILGIAEGPKL